MTQHLPVTSHQSPVTSHQSPVTSHQSPVTSHPSQDLRASQSPFSLPAIQFQELDMRRFFQLDAEMAGDLAQGVIEVREMIDGHVSNEGAANFVVTGAAVQPAEEEDQLK